MTAFRGYRVLDFTQGIPGPMATMLLADFEAEVIKIETPAGDCAKDEPGYLAWNRNKRRLVLDVDTPADHAAASELLRTADVAVFDHRPGELERLGFDARTLLATNPSLLHVWLPMYSTRGPWSTLAPDDALLTAITGSSFLQYSYEDIPVWFVTPMVSYHYALSAATAMVASLYERCRTGKGQSLVVTGLDAFAITQSGAAIQAEGLLRPGRGLPGARGGVPNYRLYQCADGQWIFLGTLTAKFFLRALEVLGLTELLAHEAIGGEYTNLMTGVGRDLVIAALDAKFTEKPLADWMRILADADIPRAPAGRREEWFRSEVIAANEMRIELSHPSLGPVLLPGVPAKLSRHPGSVRHLMTDLQPEDVPAHVPEAPSARSAAAAMGRGPLAGVTVLDLGGYVAGTFGPTVLASYGADVIKVEAPDGDPFRFTGLMFVGHNQGKRSLALDLKHPAAHEAILAIVRRTDLVLDNFRRGVSRRLGLDYASLRQVNPEIITCSVTGYGRGPMADRPGFDPLVQAESGMMRAQGGEGEPVFHQIPMNDEATAIMNAFGMLVALVARERFGGGQSVETALANQSILLQSGELTWYEGRPPARVGARDCRGTSAFRRMYACADGWIAVACQSPGDVSSLSEALGHPEWCESWDGGTWLDVPTEGGVAQAIARALRGQTRTDVLDSLGARAVPAAPALRIEEVNALSWLVDEGFYMESLHPQFGPMQSVRGYATWSRTPTSFARRAPMLGEHTVEVLEEFGVPAATIARLRGEQALVQWDGQS